MSLLSPHVSVAALLLLACAQPRTGASAPAPSGPGSSDRSAAQYDVAVPMRDGVVLRADVYLPARDGPFPTLVYRTPYGKAAAAETYDTHTEAVRRGYAVVLQDVRGRHASEGEFEPYINEGRDGYDTIEWAARQPWSTGRIGTFGLSYPGAVQWLAAMERPPHLEAMAPAMTFSTPRRFFYMNGIFDLSWLPWIYQYVAPDRRARQGLAGIRTDAEAERAWPGVADEYRRWLPLRELPYLREEAPFYFTWLEHPPESAWWDWAELRGRYGRVDAAVLNLSGWFDEAYGTEGAATNFNGIEAARTATGARTHLVLGPWVHGVGATESSSAGTLDFGAAAAIDYDDLVLDFFDHYLRSIDNDFASGAPVRFFVMGENRWRDAADWPPPEALDVPLYLAATSARSLGLSFDEPADTLPSSAFRSDPREPVVAPHDSLGPRDYRELAARGDLLTFDSPLFEDGVTIAGNLTAVVHASCDCRDFDLWVRLYDVYPDGRVLNLMSPGNDVVRASYRDPDAGPQPVAPGTVYELTLPLMSTALRIGEGHRLRAQISGSFMPYFSRNLQTGLSERVSAESRPATITIWHGEGRPSRLILPVLEE
jgi:putative CocE/NonD family hydrolase